MEVSHASTQGGGGGGVGNGVFSQAKTASNSMKYNIFCILFFFVRGGNCHPLFINRFSPWVNEKVKIKSTFEQFNQLRFGIRIISDLHVVAQFHFFNMDSSRKIHR